MDFRFTEKEEALKQEVAEFARKELPPDFLSLGVFDEVSHDWDFTMSIAKKLGEKGWLTRHWPKEYGGLEASPIENMVFRDETAYWGIPGLFMGIGSTHWVGPLLIRHGTEEQRKKYLPPISAGEPEGVWCTAYSEPDAGTDLASLKTRAVKVGEEYIVNGNKIWQTAGHRARWCWLLCRTNPDLPQHKGMSLLIVDMRSPGLTVRPVIDMSGYHSLNELFFDDVHVPVANLVGEENRGWYYVMEALNLERGTTYASGMHKRVLDELVKYAKETTYNGEPLSKDPIIRHKLAEIAVAIEACRMLQYKIAWMESVGQMPVSEASMVKTLASDIHIRHAAMEMEILGHYSMLRPGSKWTKLHGILIGRYLHSFVGPFGGGCNEIQRNIIAWMDLGLPKQ